MSLRVVRLSAGSTFQDRGRPGWRRFGVPPGGAFDRSSYELALALLGRTDGTALEIPMLGGAFELLAPDVLAVTGAPCLVCINEEAVPSNSAFPVMEGDRLEIQTANLGARTYLSSKGGWETPNVLGSVSGCVPEVVMKSGALIRTIEKVPVGDTEGSPVSRSGVTPGSPTASIRQPGGVQDASPDIFNERLKGDLSSRMRRLGFPPSSLQNREIRFVLGPQARPSDLAALGESPFRVSLASNRVGLRLEGGEFEPYEERVSEPSCVGAIQLAPSGELLVHGPDGPTVGGYPKIGVVIQADHDRLGQLRPMEEVRFTRVSLDEARVLSKEHHERLMRTVAEVRWGARQ